MPHHDVDELLTGRVFAAGDGVPYPRALVESPLPRLPIDTWQAATVPVGVRLEWVGDATVVEIDHECATTDLGYRGDGAGSTFDAHRGDEPVASVPASIGPGTARLELPPSDGSERTVVYLPEGMHPTVTAVRPVEGDLAPAPRRPLCVVYGDSIAEGWTATAPSRAWPAVAGRRLPLDMVNLGYAGAARGELVSAEHLAALASPGQPGVLADLPPIAALVISHGTNCWNRVTTPAALFAEGLRAFLDVVRSAHPTTPIVALSPIVRPDAEDTPNALGSTLADLRGTFESVIADRIASGDSRLSLVEGRHLVTADQLADGVHPGDAGHAAVAEAMVEAIARAAGVDVA